MAPNRPSCFCFAFSLSLSHSPIASACAISGLIRPGGCHRRPPDNGRLSPVLLPPRCPAAPILAHHPTLPQCSLSFTHTPTHTHTLSFSLSLIAVSPRAGEIDRAHRLCWGLVGGWFCVPPWGMYFQIAAVIFECFHKFSPASWPQSAPLFSVSHSLSPPPLT